MTTLSLAMIVKNESETIERVLHDAQGFCDELIVMDTGSSDDTVAKAEACGAKVFHFEWIDHFAAARNAAFAKASGDWIIWLDADDVIPPDQQAAFRTLKPQLHDDVDGVFVSYHLSFDGEGRCTYSTVRERLIRRASGLQWENAIHECIAVPFQRALRRADLYIEHRPLPEKKIHKVDRNLRILSKEVDRGDRSPRTLFYYASELRDHDRHAEAVPVFTEYLTVSNVAWEKYEALIRLADCLQKSDQPDLALDRLMQAIALDSTRAEAFNKVGLYFYHREQWAQAVPFFTAAMALPRPSDGFIDDAHYTWIPPDYLSICYDRLKNYPQAIALTMQALQNSPDKARLIKNMHWFVDQL